MTEKETTLADLLLDKAIKWTSDAVFKESDRAAVENVVNIYRELVSASTTRFYAEQNSCLHGISPVVPEPSEVFDSTSQEPKTAKPASRKKEKPAVVAETTPADPEPEKPIAEEKVEEPAPPVTEETVLAAAEEVLPESTAIELKDLTDIYWKWHGKYSTTDTEKWLKLKKRMEEIRDSFGAASLSAIKPESLAAAHALFADIQDPA